MKKTVWIIEDNLAQLKQMKELLQQMITRQKLDWQVMSDINYIQLFESPEKLPIHPQDVVILDIDLNTYFTGIDLAVKLKKTFDDLYLVFLTNYESFSIDAINSQVHAFQYIVKDFEAARLEPTIKKLILLVQESDRQLSLAREDTGIVLNLGHEHLLVPIADIDFVSSIPGNRGNIFVQTQDTQLLCRGSVKRLQPSFEEKEFTQNLKSYIINLRNIQSISFKEQTILFFSGNTLDIGKRIIAKIQQAVKDLY